MTKISKTKIAIITVSYNSQLALDQLALNLEKQRIKPQKWIIINNSINSSGEIKINTSCELIIINGNDGDGFGKGCNKGLDILYEQNWDGWVWLLNPDIDFYDIDVINNIHLKLLELPSKALIGTAVLDKKGSLESSAGWFDKGLNFRSRNVQKNMTYCSRLSVDWLSGCSLLFKPIAHLNKPRFDETFPLYYEDIDFCLRFRKIGIPILWLPSIKVIHYAGEGSITSVNRRLRLSTCSYIRFLIRHTKPWVYTLRIIRLLTNISIRLFINPTRSLSILIGFLQAFQRSNK